MLVAEAWAEILVCRARLRFPRLFGTESWLRRELGCDQEKQAGTDQADVLLLAFRRAQGASPEAAGCLPRALALRRYLARHGQQGRLGLGLKREKGRLRGHAWVEVAGRIASDDEAFVRSFTSLQAARSARSVAPFEEG